MDKEEKPRAIDAGRAEVPKFVPDEEVKREFDEAARFGSRATKQVIDELRMRQSTPDITAGDIDADAQPTDPGDESPHGDNPTPDQSVVDDIGRAEGLTYEDNEELKPNEKVEERDQRRWELDPASSEDYPERVKPAEKPKTGKRRIA